MYVIRVVIKFDLPGLETERTQDVILEQEQSPSPAEVAAAVPGAVQYLLQYPQYEFQRPAYANATYTYDIEAIFHVSAIE